MNKKLKNKQENCKKKKFDEILIDLEKNKERCDVLNHNEKSKNNDNLEKTVLEKNIILENEDEDELLINFILSNQKELNKKNFMIGNEVNLNNKNYERSESEDSSNEFENLENKYVGKPLIREQQLEKLFLKYVRPLSSKKKEKIALNLTRNINVEMGEGKYKNYVLVNKEPFLINNKITLNYKKTIGFHLNKSHFGFSYFCNYFDKRFGRICFQPFKCKKEITDHYYSLHLQKLKNYYCNDNNCKRAYTFYKQMKGHLINCHGITSKFDENYTRISYQFTEKWNIEDLNINKASVLVQNRVLEMD